MKEIIGQIQYMFKGKKMKSEEGVVIKKNLNELIVSRCFDKENLKFYDQEGSWILEGCESNKHLLNGTEFIPNNQ